MNRLTLAVAGSRKTQSIVDECLALDGGATVLVLTYTTSNQLEIERRLRSQGGPRARVEVMGWFSFLITHWVRPYLPLVYRGRRIHGLNFDGDPGRYATDEARYLDDEGRVYRRHLPKLCASISDQSLSAIDRLSRIYTRIYIDEVQDLCGYDLEILLLLIKSGIEIVMVGDVRQALLATNPRERKNKKYMYSEIHHWFEKQRKTGLLQVEHQNRSWRCNQAICDFADSIFGSAWGFPQTKSENFVVTDHDGVHAVAPADVDAYVAAHNPLCLRYSRVCGAGLDLNFMNFGEAKGLTAERVLIHCTDKIERFVHKGKLLAGQSACGFYVAVTRAQSSVGLILEPGKGGAIPFWVPPH